MSQGHYHTLLNAILVIKQASTSKPDTLKCQKTLYRLFTNSISGKTFSQAEPLYYWLLNKTKFQNVSIFFLSIIQFGICITLFSVCMNCVFSQFHSITTSIANLLLSYRHHLPFLQHQQQTKVSKYQVSQKRITIFTKSIYWALTRPLKTGAQNLGIYILKPIPCNPLKANLNSPNSLNIFAVLMASLCLVITSSCK